jgi:N-acetylneuraminate synthase
MGVLIIAEVGSVHDGSLGLALHLIDAAAESGADAVKFQTHIAEAETLREAPMPPYFQGEPRYEYFERTSFTQDQWRQLKARCDERGVIFMSSPFSEEAVDLLEPLGMTHYKIPSGEVTNLPLLDKIACLGKPVLLSSGMSTWDELDRAVKVVRAHHNLLTMLQCTTEYPCPPERVGLNVMLEMRDRYGVSVGLSDHTLTIYAPIAAVALGAQVIEKHFTLSRRMYGSDARHSLEPEEFAGMARGIRAVEAMLANPVDKSVAGRFVEMKEIFQKSVVAIVDIPAGAVIGREMLGIKKPGAGLPAARIDELPGKRTTRAVGRNQLLQDDDIRWES